MEQPDREVDSQTYVWDNNVAFMTEREHTHIFLQDELGSTVRLSGIQEKQQTIYGYDEFGQDLYQNQGEVQPFGYTGYQSDNIANTYFAQAREYMPKLGRFNEKDPIENGSNWYIYCKNSPMRFVDPSGLAEYIIGQPVEPQYVFDEDFVYDPNAKATLGDYANYAKWGAMAAAAQWVMPEGARAYNHYRSNLGTDLEVDFNKALKEDSYYGIRFGEMISEAQNAVENMHKSSGKTNFSTTGTLFNLSNGTSENWQKVLGGFRRFPLLG